MTIPQEYIEDLLVPMLSSQIFLAVLIYFVIMRKRLGSSYKLYTCFLVTFIIFLVGRTFQEFVGTEAWQKILYLRMFLLFAAGIPSLLIAIALQSGLSISRRLYALPYAIGTGIALSYITVMDAAHGQLLFTPEMLSFLPQRPSIETGRSILLFGAFICLVLPTIALIIKEVRGARSSTLFAFLIGTLLFGCFMMIGAYGEHSVSLYYTGSIATACCWAWAVVKDIRDTRGKAWLLKEELRFAVLSGQPTNEAEIQTLLDSLEGLSGGDLELYKLRIREILSSLVDATVVAGGETNALLQRHKAQSEAIETSSDTEEIRQLVQTEASELNALIAQIPSQQANVVANRAKAYLNDHYFEDINVETVAEHLNLSRAHLMREFKKATGETVNQYITTLRIERAKALLVTRSVTETAHEVGFNNSNYFSTVFKKHAGVTPITYKKSVCTDTDS